MEAQKYTLSDLRESNGKETTSLLKPIMPENQDFKAKRSELWCCYCGKVQSFSFRRGRKSLGSGFCVVCGISVANFYIRSANKLW